MILLLNAEVKLVAQIAQYQREPLFRFFLAVNCGWDYSQERMEGYSQGKDRTEGVSKAWTQIASQHLVVLTLLVTGPESLTRDIVVVAVAIVLD